MSLKSEKNYFGIVDNNTVLVSVCHLEFKIC